MEYHKLKVVILAGGQGTRIREFTDKVPKPFIHIGDYPIIWHIMDIYSSFGFNEFIIALGYKGNVIKDYFLNFHNLNSDVEIDLNNGNLKILKKRSLEWKISFVNTGLETQTGGRLKKLKKYLNSTFMVTYGDGLSNVNINNLYEFHKNSKSLITITSIHPTSKYGKLSFNNDCAINRFEEKPEFGGDWINGGFMVVEPDFLDYIDGDNSILEKEPFQKAIKKNQMYAYQHNGFWKCMDTIRDYQELNKLYESNSIPWKKKII